LQETWLTGVDFLKNLTTKAQSNHNRSGHRKKVTIRSSSHSNERHHGATISIRAKQEGPVTGKLAVSHVRPWAVDLINSPCGTTQLESPDEQRILQV
jgi:hypothetical protein